MHDALYLSIRFNPNPERSIAYTLSLDVHLTPISYVWPNMFDLSILISPVKYATDDLAQKIVSMKQHRRFTRKLE